jgi:tagatose 6-phosphate kinase
MILVVCLNPALDVTHHVPAVDWAGVNRPAAVHSRPGGKGLNVARTLHALGADVLLMGLAGGGAGVVVETALRRAGVPAAFIQICGETRHTFTIVDGRGTTILDTNGQALLHGVTAGPAIVKPNLDELAAASGRRLSASGGIDLTAVSAAATGLRTAGAGAVVASLGPAGLLAVTGDGSWHARPAAVTEGNATGAGDAVTAALVHGLVLSRPWHERLRHAVALGAATVAAPVAGEFSHDSYRDGLRPVAVRLEEVP